MNLIAYSTDSPLVYLTTPLWLASFPLLTAKTIEQVSGTTLSPKGKLD